MRVTSAELFNVGSIDHLLLPCGSVTLASGANGSGKTSIINGITAVFDGGHRPDLIGPHREDALILINLDNGTRIERRIDKLQSSYRVITADGSVIKSPATYVQNLVSGMSLNPTGLVDAPAKKRVEFLHEAMPIIFTREEVAKAAEADPAALERPQFNIDQFNAFRQGRYEQRTSVNRWIRDLQGTRKTVATSLPLEDETDWPKRTVELQDLVDTQRKSLSELRIQSQKDTTLLKGEIRENLEKTLDEIRRRMEAEMDEARRVADTELARIQTAADQVLADLEAPISAEISRLNLELGTARERAATQQKAQGVREHLKKIDADTKAKVTEMAKLDRAIQNLDELKKAKLASLPIQDVEVIDGQIYYKGLNFDTQLNTAQKYLLSFQVAALTLGDLPFMIFDGAEALDEDNRREFIEAIKESGFQVVMATVESGKPLTTLQVA